MGRTQCSATAAHSHRYQNEEGRDEVEVQLCQGEQVCQAGGMFMQAIPTILLKNSPQTGAEPGKELENGHSEAIHQSIVELMLIQES